MRIPKGTYRIQFNPNFGFKNAENILEYLAELGISDLYASPIFKARSGSTHGYDVVDANQLNPELGTERDFEALINKIKSYNMGWLQDIVPNHMAYDTQNPILMDILENGPDSEWFDFFDIDWNHPYENLRGRILAPMLGNFYGECLENGEIQLGYDQSGLSVNYFGLTLPIRIESYTRFITYNLGFLARSLGRHHADFVKFLGILYLIKSIPGETKGKERYDQIAFVKGLLWELYSQNPTVKEFIDTNIQVFNGEKGNAESFNLLDGLLNEQFYRLSFWKVGAEELNYRRFFTVNELISVKVEELKVFNKSHALIETLIQSGQLTGLRIDHIDGLYDPTQYLERLREKMGDVYITVEKILESQEDLPNYWPIQGTSGYDFLNYVNGLFCQVENEHKLREIYRNFTGIQAPYQQLFIEKKQLIVEKNMAGDVDNLAQLLKRVSGHSRVGSDFTLYGLKRALAEVLTAFPVYRTYINQDGLRGSDRFYVQEAIANAKKQVPLLLNELNYIEKLLLLEDEEFVKPEQKELQRHFVMRLQQLTGPLMAKGIEDTLLYVYNPLISLNEVGGNPSHFGITVTEFHEFNQKQHELWPHKMNATATHDTKRGEDARARINVISEMPETWEKQVQNWREINHSNKTEVNGLLVPEKNDEYFFYQTLVGSFPFAESELEDFTNRVKDYVIKAVREAKVHTAWLRPDTDYENNFLRFVETVLKPGDDNKFLQSFLPFQKSIAHYGILNSLSQTLLKMTASGIPDFYQGTEFWDLSMVDPDNRRPVNFEQRQAALKAIKKRVKTDVLGLIAELLAQKEDGCIKLFLILQALAVRNQNLAVFQSGSYQLLVVEGSLKDHVIAFARSWENQVAIALVPRLLTSVVQPGEFPLGTKVWQDTFVKLPPGMPTTWKNAIAQQTISTNGKLLLGEALQYFPVALLIS